MATDTFNIDKFMNAVHDRRHVSGYTHDFYNYPARFSPLFAREAIKTFSEPGDLIVDPFMGGGTTLVEARLLKRNALGFDISSLAHFLTSVKASPIEPGNISLIKTWSIDVINNLNCHKINTRPQKWIDAGYHRNLSNRSTWPIRKLIEQFLEQIESSDLPDKVRNVLRCVLLKTGQWALDSKKNIPSAGSFREKLIVNIQQICSGLQEYYSVTNEYNENIFSIFVNEPANKIAQTFKQHNLKSPKLILTSPPYPGVHILYHRWQINGRRETPAPFWIANSLDGQGLTHYTMGGRHQEGLTNYFENIRETFFEISKICTSETILIQMLAFSEPDWQMKKYLDVMNSIGFQEIMMDVSRIWREVPNRKWYAQNKRSNSSSREVVLFHRLRN